MMSFCGKLNSEIESAAMCMRRKVEGSSDGGFFSLTAVEAINKCYCITVVQCTTFYFFIYYS